MTRALRTRDESRAITSLCSRAVVNSSLRLLLTPTAYGGDSHNLVSTFRGVGSGCLCPISASPGIARHDSAAAPLFAQQQSVLQMLVDKWDGLNADERKQTLAGIFDSITASADGMDRLEPCADWRPSMVAAIPSPVLMAEDIEGVNGAEDGGQARGSDNSSARSGRARMAPIG